VNRRLLSEWEKGVNRSPLSQRGARGDLSASGGFKALATIGSILRWIESQSIEEFEQSIKDVEQKGHKGIWTL
jgi:hypothetical protein